MAEGFVQLPSDTSNTGKKIRSWFNTVGADSVASQAFTPTFTDATILADANGVFIVGGVASGSADSGGPVKVGGRYNTTLPVLTNGQRGDLQLDSSGFLRSTYGNSPVVTATLSSGGPGANSTALLVPCAGMNSVLLTLKTDAGTFTTGTIAFQASDDGGTTWFSVLVTRIGLSDSGNFGTITGDGNFAFTLFASNNYVWQVNVAGFTHFRVKMIAAITGTGTAAVRGTATSAMGTTPQTNAIVGSTGGTAVSTSAVTGDAIDFQFNIGLDVLNFAWGYNGATWDRIRLLDSFKTAAASPDVGILAAVAPDRRFNALTLGTVVGNTQQWDVNGAHAALVQIGTTTTGTVIFEVSADGTTWSSVQAKDVATDLWVIGGVAFIPTSGKIYRINTSTWRLLRIRTVTTLAATVSVTVTNSSADSIISAVDTGPAPHNYGFNELAATAQFTTAQTSTTIGPTVTSTQRMVVTYYQIQAGGTVAGTQVTLYFGTGAYSRGTSKAIFDGEFAPSATLKPGMALAKPNGWIGALDEELKLTNVGAINPLTVTIWYYLIGV